MDIKKEYQKLSKKYKLPDFKKIEKEFNISTIEETDSLLKEIRKKVYEYIEAVKKLIEPILQPDAVLSDMHECRVFNETEKKDIYELFAKIMYFERFSNEAAFSDEKKTAEYLCEFMEEFPKIKKKLKDISKRLKESWKEQEEYKEAISYLG